MSNKTLEMIAKLLAQAEGAGTEEEAATFTEKAQQLATTFSIDLAKARHLNVAKEKTVPIQRDIVIGVQGTEGLPTLIELYSGIAAANDVRIVIAYNNTRVYAYGYAEDIDVSEALYASLLTQMTEFVAQYRAEGAWKKTEVLTKVWRKNGGGVDEKYRPISWRTARLNFQGGFASRIKTRLLEAVRVETQRRAEADATETVSQRGPKGRFERVTAPGTELVLASKREAVSELIAPALKQATGRFKGSARSSQFVGSARSAGRGAADRARLGGATPLSGARRGIEQ
jgi:hypothetical protein